jgi:uncharacterized OsmC-like protein
VGGREPRQDGDPELRRNQCLDRHVVVGCEADRGANPASRQAWATIRNQALVGAPPIHGCPARSASAARRSRTSTPPAARTATVGRSRAAPSWRARGTRAEPFELDAGEPAILLGSDTGANPAEYLLHALAACLTTSIVYVAAARKVALTSVESTVAGDMDVRGALGVDDGVRNGCERIAISFRVAGDAPAEKLREVVERARPRSAVYDMVTNGVPVAMEVTTG